MHNFLTFSIVRDEIVVHQFDQMESRGNFCLNLLQAILGESASSQEGKTGWISFLDSPPDLKFFPGADLKFCTTREYMAASPFLPFPCPHSVAWPQIGLESADVLIRDFIDCEESYDSNAIFWIGSDSHPSRRKLSEMSALNPEIVDAVLMEWNRSDPNRLSSTDRHVTLWEHRRYKYLIDCPGLGYSGRLKYLLATGRPVFVVDRKYVEFWHEGLHPWVHYIPVREDLSDLIDSWKILEGNSDLYHSIGMAAKRFAEDALLVDAQIRVVSDLLNAEPMPGGDFVGYEYLIDNIVDPKNLTDLEGIFLEIGAFQGGGTSKLSRYLLHRNPEKTLLVIDPFDIELDQTRNTSGISMADYYRNFERRLGAQRRIFNLNTRGCQNVRVVRAISDEVDLTMQKIAFAFIDGGHAEETVRSDFFKVWRQLVPGGVMAFHDYRGDLPRVTSAIDRCLEEVSDEVQSIEVGERWLIWITRR